ncbi:Autoinducer 2 sensor kinase/phosphatase LuxQ [Planctomycetes bacterium Poly30]|uniref:histidine kinase n=1 Tax=Saltatorellus ferox TaxID=2528018 RepID=A0A518ELE1_9BACT|nr:Autoinducer 2 sensor kinase/phosphatase LuxQ [Planctomycetes bacterium Poly30]
MASGSKSPGQRDVTRLALDLIAGTGDIRELAQELIDEVEGSCQLSCHPSGAALYMWDRTVNACYALSAVPPAISGSARRRMAEALEEAWSATSVPVSADVSGTTVLLFPLFHGEERAGMLALVAPPPTVCLPTLARLSSAAYYLVAAAAQHVERVEAARRRSELEGTRARLEAALAESYGKQQTIEKMAASLELARAELEASHETLEDHVRERTNELATANESLAEASRRAQASSDAKSRFLAVMSHELRTPLTSILGAAELLSQHCDENENDLIATVRTAGQDVLGIVSDVLDYSRLESGEVSAELQPFLVDELRAGVVSAFASRASARGLRFDVTCRLPARALWRGDRVHVARVLEILVDNAVTYTDSGGIQITFEEMAGAPSILVSDSGPGIPVEVQERVFSAFEQADTSNARKFEGAGLGLAIARSLATLMGGELRLQSEPGRGSDFRLVLPASAGMEAAPSSAATGPPRASAPRHGRVLLVEDNTVNRRIVARLLTRMGHEVIEAVDGVEAVARALSDAPDVVLMDIQMPKMDGLEATRRIRLDLGEIARVPILALTANATPEERAQALDSGMNAFLVKPIQVETLRDAIQEALRLPESSVGPSE